MRSSPSHLTIMPLEPKIAHLAALRALIARQAPGQAALPSCPLGLPALDAALEGGLPRGCLQEVIPADEGAAAAGFAAFLLGRLAKEAAGGGRGVLWASLGEGDLYPPALAAYGLAPGEVILLSAPSPAELLWAMEEALRWRVRAGPDRSWHVELLRRRGGRPGRWILEKEDETDRLLVAAELGDGSAAPQARLSGG